MSNEFRTLNEQELRAIAKSRLPEGHVLRRSNTQVSYETQQGGFCVCVLLAQEEAGNSWRQVIFRGASRRSYKDPKNKVKGEMLAFLRAIRCSRPVAINW